MSRRNALTEKQTLFIDEYLRNRNAAEAYRRSYDPSASPRRAAECGCRLVKHPKIAPVIAAAEAKALEKTKEVVDKYALSKERVLQELAMIGLSNMGDYLKDDGDGYPLAKFSDLTREQTAAMSEVQVTSYVEGRGPEKREVKKVRFKLHDKRQALVNIAQLEGWIVERRESKDDLTIKIQYSPEERAERIQLLLRKMNLTDISDVPAIDQDGTPVKVGN